ncbi:uncharacterized protein LOC127106981 [Lathyrus oleraceus]|uniref:uncharacterized protein LOC127106981 n=1 Tax=Pisum sativum TaxID=3888 RepID=UPI0021D18BE5|nr:uncharacterized protein LOC127106981 [Pisum sativum]
MGIFYRHFQSEEEANTFESKTEIWFKVSSWTQKSFLMKNLYWNIRGIAKPPSRLALKRLLKVHKPNFLLIVKPKTSFDKISGNWFHKLGFKFFAFNNPIILSLWCFCKTDIGPTIIDSPNQFVVFSFGLDHKTLATVAVYAFICLYKRKELWKDLSELQIQHPLPWNFIGDFNAIMGACEHWGHNAPTKGPIIDFQAWTNLNQILHLPTQGFLFTLNNKRAHPYFIKRRLDWSIVNLSWLSSYANTYICTLTKLHSDCFRILLEFHINPIMLVNQLWFLKTWILHKDCSKIIESCLNEKVVSCHMLVLCRMLQLLKRTLKSLNNSTFVNVTHNVLMVEDKLDRIKAQTQISGMDANLFRQELDARDNLILALNMEEYFWNEKSRLKWHLKGDRNTAFFHQVSKSGTLSSLFLFSSMETIFF